MKDNAFDNNQFKYVLRLNSDQAHVLSRACEFYARMHIGQLNEIRWDLSISRGNCNIDYDLVDYAINILRHQLFPDLVHPGASLSIWDNNPTAEHAWNIYQVIRYALAWQEHPEGGITVNFHDPMQLGKEPLPKCEVSK